MLAPRWTAILDGNVAWDDWGRDQSSGARGRWGCMALMDQAYKDQHGIWPGLRAGQGPDEVLGDRYGLRHVRRKGAGSAQRRCRHRHRWRRVYTA